MPFSVSVTDSTGVNGQYVAAITNEMLAAAASWQTHLVHSAPIEISVAITPTGAGTADGTSASSGAVGQYQGLTLYQAGAAYEIETGIDPNGSTSDVLIRIDPTYLQNQLWFDPNPSDAVSNTVPSNRVDAFSVFEHEFGHAFGFNGWRDGTTGALPGNYLSTFDEFVQTSGGYEYFTGPEAEAVYGGPVPLTRGDYGHYGNASGPGSDLVANGLMNGVVYYYGERYPISELDLAILRDTGLETEWNYNGGNGNEVLKVHLAGTVNGGAGLDTAEFTGYRSSFTVSNSSGAISVTQPNGDVDALISIERVQFSDSVLALDIQGDAGNAYRLYQAAFARTPDEGGLSYWTHALDDGQDIVSVVAQTFVNSAEFKSVYGANPTHAQIVDAFYHNVLGRAGESAGFNYWVGRLDAGMSVAAVLESFAASPENHSLVDPKITQGIVLDSSAFLV